MPPSYRNPIPLVALFAVVGLLASGAAWAHGEKGEHVETFAEHIDAYESDVEALADELEAVVDAYKDDQQASSAMQDWIGRWKEVKYHATVETVATPLYGPIWQAITKMKDNIGNGASVATVQQSAHRLEIALREGMGAIKLAAVEAPDQANHDDDGDDHDSGAEDADDGTDSAAAEIDAIQQELDQALAEYRDGEKDAALETIQAAYLQRFEGIEGALIEQDPDLVTHLEMAFNAKLPGLIKQEANAEKVRSRVEDMKAELDKAAKLLQDADEDKGEVFG